MHVIEVVRKGRQRDVAHGFSDLSIAVAGIVYFVDVGVVNETFGLHHSPDKRQQRLVLARF